MAEPRARTYDSLHRTLIAKFPGPDSGTVFGHIQNESGACLIGAVVERGLPVAGENGPGAGSNGKRTAEDELHSGEGVRRVRCP